MIDNEARRIASEWHGGQTSALCALATSGAIDRDRCSYEISDSYNEATGQDTRDLLRLLAYVCQHRDRGPVTGWSDLHF